MIFGAYGDINYSEACNRQMRQIAAQQNARMQGLSGLAGLGVQNQFDRLATKIKKDDELRKIPMVDFYGDTGGSALKSLRDHIIKWAKL